MGTGSRKDAAPPFFYLEGRIKMDFNLVSELVNSVAFPIAAFVMLFYYCVKVIEDLRKTIEENTIVMTKLMEKLDGNSTEV